ncbi:MAG: hypothetical protein Q7R63_01665, partial [bacterium]|nr:hypothetical protein [bacterium]
NYLKTVKCSYEASISQGSVIFPKGSDENMCGETYLAYMGHDRELLNSADAAIQCIKVTQKGITVDEYSCGPFRQSTSADKQLLGGDPLEREVKGLQSRLRDGQYLTWSGNQATAAIFTPSVLFGSSPYVSGMHSPTTLAINITPKKSVYNFPSCKDLGEKKPGGNTCLKLNEIASCINDEGVLSKKRCCLRTDTYFPKLFMGIWSDENLDTGACPGDTIINSGECTVSVLIKNFNESEEFSSKLNNSLKNCLGIKEEGCDKVGGRFQLIGDAKGVPGNDLYILSQKYSCLAI